MRQELNSRYRIPIPCYFPINFERQQNGEEDEQNRTQRPKQVIGFHKGKQLLIDFQVFLGVDYNFFAKILSR
jgi:hypothetical protein